MANVKKSTPRKVSTKRKQGHKLIWFTVIVIAIPVIFVAYVLLTSAVGQDKPVIGNRFGSNDLNQNDSLLLPKIIWIKYNRH